MKRLPARVRRLVWSLDKTKQDLRILLPRLGVRVNSKQVDTIYHKLGLINGVYFAHQHTRDGLALSVLQSLAADLTRFSELFGFDTNTGPLLGPKSIPELMLHEHLVKKLARLPSVASSAGAEDLLNRFRADAMAIASVCAELYSECNAERKKGGRHTIDWYDNFAELLQELARRARVGDSVWIDRISGKRGSWLVIAANRLESFLLPPMRSPTAQACAKRLERSLKRLRGTRSLQTKQTTA